MKRAVALPARAARMASTHASSGSKSVLPLDPPSVDEEQAAFERSAAEVDTWFASERFKGIRRPYAGAAVASKRGTLPVSDLQPANLAARKLFALLSRNAEAGKPVHTMGVIDPMCVVNSLLLARADGV